MEMHHPGAASRHLPEAGESGLHGVPLVLPRVVAGNDLHQLGPRADEAHVAANDVPELRQLVEAPSAEEAPEIGVTRIAVALVGHTTVVLHRRVAHPHVAPHRPELDHVELAT